MVFQVYLAVYDGKVRRVFLRRSTEDCAALLGLDLCFDHDCGDRVHDHPHAHVPDSAFGPPQFYPPDDARRAGLRFRDGILPVIGVIRWELYDENDPRRVIYFEPQFLEA